MLAVYETIDLGLISTLSKVTPARNEPPILDLLQGNHPVFLQDPIHDETIYVYHAFGVHALQLGTLLQNLAIALRDDISNDGNESLSASLEKSGGTVVRPILSTFSVERKCSNPVVAVAIPNDVYLTYSIFILTSAMRITTLPLTLQSELQHIENLSASVIRDPVLAKSQIALPLPEAAGPPGYITLLSDPFVPPSILSRASSGLPTNPILALPPSQAPNKEFQLTPDTLRFFASTVEKFNGQIHDVTIAYRACDLRAILQKQESIRQQQKCKEMLEQIEYLRGKRQELTREKIANVQETQKVLLGRLDRILRAMMKTASPELSEHETKWFQELKRMKEDIKGSTRYDQESLVARTGLLRREFDRLLPSLKELQAKEERIKKRTAEGTTGLGFSQAFEYGERSNAERVKIGRLENDLTKLATRLDVTLGKPPPLQSPTNTK
ncbi:hypothetical protein PHLCEN_2v12301 [Hermanssonia centrifuga]|uniref:Uncharacterized protein n=1 Tax=Hermanssonia centrifuga TaxID=98765 RepID=A0A2R6NHF3_9APHY|nr:hypothetical protein PHLCEN_2v12301 [Hermanssonia centrifuga]